MTHEKITYINSRGDTVFFGANSLYMDEIALGWKFNANMQGKRIVSYSMGTVSFVMPGLIIADSVNEANALKDRIHDVIFYDVMMNEKGRLIYRGFTLNCNIIEVTNKNYQEEAAFGDIELTVNTDEPFWYHEKSESFIFHGDVADRNVLSVALDYPYDYPIDFYLNQKSSAMMNDSIIPCDFVLRIQGQVVNPSVYINDHKYGVNIDLSQGDTLMIDSSAKTVTLINARGAVFNALHERNRDSYIFEKVPGGSLSISTSQNLSIELTLVEKRGEPTWT